MGQHIVFVTTGDVENIATSKRAFGMAGPLVARGFKVSLILEDTPSNRSRASLEAPMATFHWFERRGALSEMMAKRMYLKKIRPDVVYVSSFGMRNMVCPVRSVEATYLLEYSELPSVIKNRPISRRVLDYLLERISLRCFDGHICASKYLLNLVQGKLSKKHRYRAIYSPYAFTRSVLLPNKTRAATKRREGPLTLLYMGTLAPNYGIFHILEAMKCLKEQLDVRLVILGKGRSFKEAVARSEEMDLSEVVDFKGYVPEEELPTFFQSADAFIAPIFNTLQDIARCPSKMFMYLAYNRPVVTSKIGEAYELFGPDYQYYYEPDDVGDMTTCLAKALQTPNDWLPNWSSRDHEWDTRAREFEVWLNNLQVSALTPSSSKGES